MSLEVKATPELEIGHVLFMDIVGYSKLLVDEQSHLQQQLKEIVRDSTQVRAAEASGKLVRVPTGDGMALVFFTNPEAPTQCALEISRTLKDSPQIQMRMGVHSGPINKLADVNEQTNVAGGGINIAQRVMDCGDAGHILLSKRVAEDLAQYGRWQPHLHDLGECEVKHGIKIHVVNLCTDDAGNCELPTKFKRASEEQTALARRAVVGRRRNFALISTGIAVLLLLAFFFLTHGTLLNSCLL
jgi:class 3 adenylate cyclase